MKTILRVVKIILLTVGLETGYAERSRIFVQVSAIFVQASAESNLFGLCRAQPKISNTMLWLVKIRATFKVAII